MLSKNYWYSFIFSLLACVAAVLLQTSGGTVWAIALAVMLLLLAGFYGYRTRKVIAKRGFGLRATQKVLEVVLTAALALCCLPMLGLPRAVPVLIALALFWLLGIPYFLASLSSLKDIRKELPARLVVFVCSATMLIFSAMAAVFTLLGNEGHFFVRWYLPVCLLAVAGLYGFEVVMGIRMKRKFVKSFNHNMGW